jgi:hypothetical protein
VYVGRVLIDLTACTDMSSSNTATLQDVLFKMPHISPVECETQPIGLVVPDRIRDIVAAQNTVATKFSTTLEAVGELNQVKSLDLGDC